MSMNFWGFQRSFVDEGEARFPEFLDRILAETGEGGVLPAAAGQPAHRGGKGPGSGPPQRGQVYGVTYREDKPGVVAALADMTARGLYPENLWGI